MENKTNKKHRKKLKHYNIHNHAHELTFSCYHCYDYFNEPTPCTLFMEELDQAKNQFLFNLWAYVIMPSHVHILIKPVQDNYEISDILQSIKGKTSKRYRDILIEKDPETYKKYCIQKGTKKMFRFWQPGGGFDRNLWNTKAIHYSIVTTQHNY